jgi:hypothetical protein
MSWSIAIVSEAPADRETASALATRAACEAFDWMLPEYLSFRGFHPTESQLLWRDVKTLAGANRITVSGFFRGAPASPDAHTATRALFLFERCKDDIGNVDAVFLVRDSDNDLTRREGLNQARDAEPWSFPIVIAFAHTKRECWHIAGFEPESDAESQRLADIHQELGFHPCHRSEELTAKHDAANDKRSAKRVLWQLTNDDRDREYRCLKALPLEELAQRGKSNGLADFLTELRTHLLPLFGHHPAR